MIPPNPDDSDGARWMPRRVPYTAHTRAALPSQIHPSYPYGNPRLPSHPASRPRARGDPTPRALFEDAAALLARGAVLGPRWPELALGSLLPIDGAKAEHARAAQARKMASGAGGQPPPHPQVAPAAPPVAQGPVPDQGQPAPGAAFHLTLPIPGAPPPAPEQTEMELPTEDEGDEDEEGEVDDEEDSVGSLTEDDEQEPDEEEDEDE
jgi:hypothetical protein